MLRGLYESAVGMAARLTLQDVIANNLANVDSTGFQREVAALRARPATPGGSAGAARSSPLTLEAISARDPSAGVVRETGVAGDVALEGPGYLVVQTARGPRLLRSGSLRANGSGELSLASGEPVLGVDGRPIAVGAGAWRIKEEGTVSGADGRALGRLRLVLPTGPVRPDGGALAVADAVADARPGAVRVLAGCLERSNVEPVQEMVAMIAGMRAYEAGQRAIQAQDQTLQNLFSLLQG